jgi:hypothetical protein
MRPSAAKSSSVSPAHASASSQRIPQTGTLDPLDRFLESVARFCFRAATVARRPRMRCALQGVGQVADGQGGRGRSRMRYFS